MAGLLDGMDPGDGLLAEYAPGLLGPFQAAALRQRMAVQPIGGRLPGAMTKVAEQYLPHVLGNIATLPQRAVEASANYRATGQYDPVFMEAALTPMMGAMPFAPKGAVGAMGGKPPPTPRTTLPMDEASRMERAVAMGMMPVYRGAKAATPDMSLLASKSARVYNPPSKPLRPFEDDYRPDRWPDGAPADATGRLIRDIEGRPLAAQYVVGRQFHGGSDVALPEVAIAEVAQGSAGARISPVAGRAISGDAGRLVKTTDRRSGDSEYEIFLNRSLTEQQIPRVAAHEVGHLIDEIAGNIPTKGLTEELKAVYNTLNNPNRTGTDAANWGKPFRPQDLGYKGEEIGREHIVEAIRAYMFDPNYLKSVAPETAKAIRAAVNEHPTLSKFIQFNAAAGLLGGGALADLDRADQQ